MTAMHRWVLAIVVLLAGNLVAMVILATVASVGHSEVIPDYYQQAAHYDDTLAEASASRALGWRVDATLIDGELAIFVRDASGAPLSEAQVRVTGYPRARAQDRFDVQLIAAGAGAYRGRGDRTPGLHDLVIAVDRAGKRYVRRLLVDAR
jgi:nitrogen fixation protein FixH